MSLIDTALNLVATSKAKRADSAKTQRRAVAWLRVSTEEQLSGSSIVQQEADIRAYAADQGIEVAQVFSDDASAFHGVVSDEFARMLDAATDAGCILVWSADRFGRAGRETQRHIEDLAARGIEVRAVNGHTSLSPQAGESATEELLRSIEFFRGKLYSEAVSLHTRKCCRGNVSTRDPVSGWAYKNGGQPLWGYRAQSIDTPGRQKPRALWFPDDETMHGGQSIADWARAMLVDQALRGRGPKRIADWLSREGVPTRRGGGGGRRWSESTCYGLTRPWAVLKYAGAEVYNLRRRGNGGRLNPPTEWVIVEGAHPALITGPEAQQLLERGGSGSQ